MKFNFKKISAIATSVLMTGMTIGTAMAAGISPTDLGGQGNFAIVYGSTANSMDQAQAIAIDTALRNQFSTGTSVVVGDVALTNDEVTLGESITGGKISSSGIKNNKLSSLLKEKISWDDSSGEDTYDIYEQIDITRMNVLTTVNDSDLEGVALSNDKGLSYKLYLDTDLTITAVNSSNPLDLTILGEEYEIVGIQEGKIIVTTSSEVALSVGQTYTLPNGKVVTLTGVFSRSVEVSVDGTSRIISETSGSSKVNNVKVKVESIGYNSNAPDTSRAVLRIGEDLVKQYSTGDEFIGEDEDEPEWVWKIGKFNETASEHYIGVEYNYKTYRAKDDIRYVGEGYVLPNNYAAVTLDSITDADYQDVKVYFLEREDLYNTSLVAELPGKPDEGVIADANILVVEAESKDSIVVGGFKTNKIAFYVGGDDVYTFAYDNDGEYSPTKKWRAIQMNKTVKATPTPITEIDIAEIEVGDTFLNVGFKDITAIATTGDYTGNLTISHKKTGAEILSVTLSNLSNLDRFGANQDDADAGDIFFGKNDVSTKDYSYMDAYGVKISEGTTVESEADSDEITLSIPEEKVFAKVSVSMGASTTSTGSVGNMIFRDTESSSYAGKNVVIVGGSCVNSAAATVLGVASDRGVPGCYADTGLEAGQFLIKKGLLNGKTAIVVAGYEADDTVKAAQFLINKGAVEGKYSSTTSEIIA